MKKTCIHLSQEGALVDPQNGDSPLQTLQKFSPTNGEGQVSNKTEEMIFPDKITQTSLWIPSATYTPLGAF